MKHVKFLAFVVVLLGTGIFSELSYANGFPVHNKNTSEGFNTIQEAINDADSGHTIEVYGDIKATYPEQITIEGKQLIIDGKNNPKITLPSLRTSLFGEVCMVIIKGSDSNGTQFKGFTIDGIDTIATNCIDGISYGIWVLGAKDIVLSENNIINVRSTNPNASGCQKGIAIGIGDSGFTGANASLNVANAIISGSATSSFKIEGYQKGGIYVAGTNSIATITGYTISGSGGMAQNGIQIDPGATVTIRNNKIKSNIRQVAGFDSAGIVVNCAEKVDINGTNEISGNAVGIGGLAKSLTVSGNNIFSNITGISLERVCSTGNAEIKGNTINRNNTGLLVGFVGGFARDNIFEKNGLNNGQRKGIEVLRGVGTYDAKNNYWQDGRGLPNSVNSQCKPPSVSDKSVGTVDVSVDRKHIGSIGCFGRITSFGTVDKLDTDVETNVINDEELLPRSTPQLSFYTTKIR